MLPEINLQGDLDVAVLSPLLRGMLLSLAYADGEGGIGLTATGAMNRKFVHWAAVHFLWPGYTHDELFSVNKVLNESDMPPLWAVRDFLHFSRFTRRRKDKLLPTKRGLEFLAKPDSFFDQIAAEYLYSYVHYRMDREGVLARMPWWHVFLNVINIQARNGCTPDDLMAILHPNAIPGTIDAVERKMEISYDILRPLCWLGLMREDRDGLTILQDGTYYKTPLWNACLTLESDNQKEFISINRLH
ncbi:hypothetical protein ACTJJ7_12160 [Phyllobacterium sp. 22229]|uniref:Uncharacterized protein n=1 Tax=Agrobacterium radiobacter TaxID=362 RepID=A0ABD5LKZ7_AGRRD